MEIIINKQAFPIASCCGQTQLNAGFSFTLTLKGNSAASAIFCLNQQASFLHHQTTFYGSITHAKTVWKTKQTCTITLTLQSTWHDLHDETKAGLFKDTTLKKIINTTRLNCHWHDKPPIKTVTHWPGETQQAFFSRVLIQNNFQHCIHQQNWHFFKTLPDDWQYPETIRPVDNSGALTQGDFLVFLQQRWQQDRLTVLLSGQLSGVWPGWRVTLYLNEKEQSFLIQGIDYDNDNIRYTLLSDNRVERHHECPPQPLFQLAKITTREKKGTYTLQWHFCDNTQVAEKRPHGRYFTGFNTPLPPSQTVLTSQLEKQSIIATLSDKETSDKTYCAESLGQQQWSFSASPHNVAQLSTSHYTNLISLSQAPKHRGIKIMSTTAEIQYDTQQSFSQRCDKNSMMLSKNLTFSAKETLTFSSKSAVQHWQSPETFKLQANDCHANAQDLYLKAKEQLVLNINDGLTLKAPQAPAKLISKHCELNGKNCLHIDAAQGLTLRHKNNTITLKPDGEVVLHSACLVFGGAFSYSGTLVNSAGRANMSETVKRSPPTHPTITPLKHDLHCRIDTLTWATEKAHSQASVTAQFHVHGDPHAQASTLSLYQHKQYCGKITTPLPQPLKNGVVKTTVDLSKHLKTNTQDCSNTLSTLALNKSAPITPLTFQVTCGKTQSRHRSDALTVQYSLNIQLHYIFEKPVLQASITLAQTTSEKIIWQGLTERYPTFSATLPAFGKHALILLDNAQKNPWYQVQGDVGKQPHPTPTVTVKTLPPFMLINAHNSLKNPIFSALESDILIKQAQQQGNSVTLFVHGYNVELGELSKFINSVDKHDQEALLYFDESEATIYQTPAQLKRRFPDLKKCDRCSPAVETLNGSGAHQWLLAMEHYCHKARASDPDNYSDYQRLLGFAWAGDVFAVDYMKAVNNANPAADRLVIVVQALQSLGIQKINLIAHSLGARVALLAMNTLGKSAEVFQHVYLWEAAVPNDVFSSAKTRHPNDPWYLPYLTDSAEKITVLHSRNDNILGPIPDKQPKGLSQATVDRAKPLDEFIMATLLSALELGGVYSIAMWLGIPATQLLNPFTQDNIYKAWIKQHPGDKTGSPFPKSFNEQVIRQNNSDSHYWEHFREKVLCAEDSINERLKAAHEYKAYFASELVTFQLSHPHLTDMVKDLLPSHLLSSLVPQFDILKRLLTLVNTIFVETDYHPRPALGYSGIDQSDVRVAQHIASGKIQQIDQTDCLFSHSGMQAPSKKLFERVFKRVFS